MYVNFHVWRLDVMYVCEIIRGNIISSLPRSFSTQTPLSSCLRRFPSGRSQIAALMHGAYISSPKYMSDNIFQLAINHNETARVAPGTAST